MSGPSATSLANARETLAYWTPLVRLPEVHAVAFLGNEAGEDSFLNHAIGDKGEAVGLGQWHGARRANILAHTGIDVGTASHLDQLKAQHWEATQADGYRHVFAELLATDTLTDAVTVLVKKYEQSAQPARDIPRRVALAQTWQKILAG